MATLTIQPYSESAFVVRGDSRPYISVLKQNGGKWNPNLQGGGGYIFSNKHLNDVTVIVQQINSGNFHQVPTSVPQETKIKYKAYVPPAPTSGPSPVISGSCWDAAVT